MKILRVKIFIDDLHYPLKGEFTSSMLISDDTEISIRSVDIDESFQMASFTSCVMTKRIISDHENLNHRITRVERLRNEDV